ncbi:MAG: enoyl-CoA hydratase [Magnetovibrio sp.]|nr:enoyl-CoA hydratase [Magnetovibrio sp.]
MTITSPNSSMVVEVKDSIAHVAFNRPSSLNALDEDLARALGHITEAIGKDPSIRCVVLFGTGDHFMAGGDVKSFHTKLKNEPSRTARYQHFEKLIGTFHIGLTNMRTMPQPIIGKIRGAVAGAGVSLALACDLAIASEDAFFTLAYCNIGTSPDGGSTYSLPRATSMKRAMEIALLGDRFDAKTAANHGLINRVVKLDDLDLEVLKLAERIAGGPTRAHAHSKMLLNQSLNSTLEEQLKAEQKAFAECSITDDFAEGIAAFVEKRSASFEGK